MPTQPPVPPPAVAADGVVGATVAVLFGGPSPEHDVSILTGLQALHELGRAGRRAFGIYWSKVGDFYRVEGLPEAKEFAAGLPPRSERLALVAGPGAGGHGGVGSGGGFHTRGRLRMQRMDLDVVLNCCHGGPGEDGAIQGMLDSAGVLYTGQGAAGSSLCMDKLAFHGVAGALGIPTLPRRLLPGRGPAGGDALGGRSHLGSEVQGGPGASGGPTPAPLVIKPRYGGSSIGVEVVADMATAVARASVSPHLGRGAVVEPYRSDLVDLNVAMRSWPSFQLSAIERPLKQISSNEILAFDDKYAGFEGMAGAPRELPAKIDGETADAVAGMSREIAAAISLRGVVRVDFLWGGGAGGAEAGAELYLNEVNSIPGSLSRYLWIEPPLAFLQLIDDLVAEALAGPPAVYGTSGADGALLDRAVRMASKLA